MPTISIIIPTYNEEANIGRLLKSIKEQTYKNSEVIVVDDGSTDRTVELARKYTSKVYPRKHAERSIQRNFGASKARGRYLLFLDADMVLTPRVLKDCVKRVLDSNYKALVIPEKTVGSGMIASVRRFEREMYAGDLNIEVARFFDRKVFNEFSGYDPKLTGPEDYDLPYRISKKYSIGRVKEYILHNESRLNFMKLLKKRFYYASHSYYYVKKHPELVLRQGILVFRAAYLRNWKKFLKQPIIGLTFLFIRSLETVSAFLGFIKALVSR